MLKDMESHGGNPRGAVWLVSSCRPQFLQVLDVLWEQGGEVDSKLPDWNTSSTPSLAPFKWQDVQEEEAVLCSACQQRLRQGLGTANVFSKLLE